MFTILDSELDQVFSGTYMDALAWFDDKTYSQVFYVFNHEDNTFVPGIEFYRDGNGR